ncbi:hypothetical protein [Microbacterium murale]|uniref:Nucleosome binding factor SPN SPT16 subunit n=1 Tax=Microbacterium murale TaxID=1081040 RepID=A0ABU0P4T3_9MICO|nr:hypothetical protein [Microbacterium murale]MDQ0642343.1 nucleosome binding factor SPN SPT16 subunit [Microbacterium murale]
MTVPVDPRSSAEHEETSGEEATTANKAGEPNPPDDAEEPTTEDLQEPSTEKAPGEEPKAPDRTEPEPSHEAVGIGIIGRPQTEMDEENT